MSEDDNSEKNQTSKNKEYHWNKSKKKKSYLGVKLLILF